MLTGVSMARMPRRRAESDIYHVMLRGVGRQIIFEDPTDRRFFLVVLKEELNSHRGELLCWCLIDNHVHLLVRVAFEELSKMMQAIGSTYATFFNRRHDRVGHLFQDRFRSEPVDTEAYLLTVVRYIHQNPVKEGLSPTCSYRWSSYQEYLGRPAEDCLVARDLVLSLFDCTEQFVRFHQLNEFAGEVMDVDTGSRRMNDETLLRIARSALGEVRIEDVSSLPRAERNDALRALLRAHLSVRQIERLTGVSRGVISKL